jgi:hypothetical protein
MKSIEQIIEDKRNGIDCTEEESAEIKGFLRESFLKDEHQSLISEIGELFPWEYFEWAGETEEQNKTK